MARAHGNLKIGPSFFQLMGLQAHHHLLQSEALHLEKLPMCSLIISSRQIYACQHAITAEEMGNMHAVTSNTR